MDRSQYSSAYRRSERSPEGQRDECARIGTYSENATKDPRGLFGLRPNAVIAYFTSLTWTVFVRPRAGRGIPTVITTCSPDATRS